MLTLYVEKSKQACAIEGSLHEVFFCNKKYEISPLYSQRWTDRKDIVDRKRSFGNQLLLRSLGLDIQLLGFDPKERFAAIVSNSAAKTSEDTNSSRPISMHATVRGMGGGKSRALQELCFEALLEKNNCLAVAVTFNSITSLLPDEKRAWQAFSSKNPAIKPEDLLAFSVCARLISSFYDVEFPLALTELQRILMELPDGWSGSVLLVAVVNHMLVRTRQTRPVDKFFLLIDESKRAADPLRKHFPAELQEYQDVYSPLRDALLSPKFHQRIAHPMLLMSGLQVLPSMMQTSPHMPIIAMPLTEQLDHSGVAQRLLAVAKDNIILNTQGSSLQEGDLMLWAPLFASIPRTLELALTAIGDAAEQRRSVEASASALTFDAAFASAWLYKIRDLIWNQYIGMDFSEVFNDQLVRSLVLSEKVSVVGTQVRNLIELSDFTNAIARMPAYDEGKRVYLDQYIVPVASPILMWVKLTDATGAARTFNSSPLFTQMSAVAAKAIDGIEKHPSLQVSGTPRNSGQLLEDLFEGVIGLRLLSFAVSPHSKTQRRPFRLPCL